MPTVKPNISRIILAWNRQKTDVVLSKETNETSAAVPTTTTTTLATTGEVNSTTTVPAITSTSTMRPVDISDRTPVWSVNSTTTPTSKTKTRTTTTTSKKPPKRPTLSSTSRPRPPPPPSPSSAAPSAAQEELEEWMNQIHGPLTPRPYVAERDCGIRAMAQSREGRVVGGRDSQLGEFPWSVLIRETTLLGFFVKTKCGGALIDLKWVLTAAHCKPGMFGSLEVVVGETDLGATHQSGAGTGTSSKSAATSATPKLRPIVRRVKRMIVHRDYNPSNFDNDIALLELESPYQVQPHVVPICLPEKEESFIGQQAMVAGWGKLSFGGPVPQVLQVARLPVIGNKQCQQMYHDSGHIKLISDSFLCAGYASGGHDSCEGDSGGPLQIQRPHDGRWVLAGTVSHGIKCAEPNLPGIYIRIAAYLPWIKAVTYQQDHNRRYGYRRQFTRSGSVQLQ